jgi:hypothetical protein
LGEACPALQLSEEQNAISGEAAHGQYLDGEEIDPGENRNILPR